ncbi:MAG: hypothetical protein HQM09_16785 [Candidatus Riflebacteria bacterium]|nr:hypothetical protein [Candidatus Riflebacteria bacterium]
MKQRFLLLAVLFSIICVSPVLNAATGELSSESTLSPGTPWTEWKEFQASDAGTKVFWRFGFSDASRQAFSVQLKNETGSVVSFQRFTVDGVGTGKDVVWRGNLEPNKVSTMKGTLAPSSQQSQGGKRVIKARLEGLAQGLGGLTEEERQRLNSPEVKKAKNYTKNLYEKYIQGVGAGTPQNVNKGLIGKYKDAKQAEDKAKSDAVSGSGSTPLETPTNPGQGSAASPAFNPDF